MFMEGEEIHVPVPWGEIRGRQWGHSDGHPWICGHGFLDNCGSLEPLVKLLIQSGNHRFICYDLPGHGFSSHYPKGFTYQSVEGLAWINYIADHFQLEKFSLMAHSYGGHISALYAGIFPERVESLILIDIRKIISQTKTKKLRAIN